jgi:hypothetical protein
MNSHAIRGSARSSLTWDARETRGSLQRSSNGAATSP